MGGARGFRVTAPAALLAASLILWPLSGCDSDGSSDANAPVADDGGEIALERAFPHLTFDLPLGAFQPPRDDETWFVIERAGRVLSFADDAEAADTDTVLDITAAVDTSGEGGLLGLAFHPEFGTPGAAGEDYVYLSYTETSSPLNSMISRFTYDAPAGTLDPASEFPIIEVEQPAANHNGGHIAFGHDGHLYVGLGDGGGSGDPDGHGQDTTTLLGAMLRIDVDGGSPYAVPAGNPFVGVSGADEIYAWGFRNPWRWSFDRDTGELWLGDVGQGQWEEVDRVERGGNYGWNAMEGTHCYESGCDPDGFELPAAEYSHDSGCSITGGYVYRGGAIPSLEGQYLYADFCSGTLWSLDTGGGSPDVRLETDMSVVSFAESAEGELFILDYAIGTLHRIVEQ